METLEKLVLPEAALGSAGSHSSEQAVLDFLEWFSDPTIPWCGREGSESHVALVLWRHCTYVSSDCALGAQGRRFWVKWMRAGPVSYTHLTQPTICSV